jgi:hypothetical protein
MADAGLAATVETATIATRAASAPILALERRATDASGNRDSFIPDPDELFNTLNHLAFFWPEGRRVL